MQQSARRPMAVLAAAAMVAGGLALAAPQEAAASDWSRCLEGPPDRQAAFARAANVSGVPVKILLAVSYMESRWDHHGSSPSTSGGYGPMHLTDLARFRDDKAADKGESAVRRDRSVDDAGTLGTAAELTGLGKQSLRADDVANICGGAAVLASYQQGRPGPGLGSWSEAVARYSGAGDEATALRFTRQVFDVLRDGKARTTDDGHPMKLPASPGARPDPAAVRSMGLTRTTTHGADCPRRLGCESIPAPYEWYGAPNPYAYGNHDVADRPHDLDIDYIVVHNTEADWDTTLDLVQDPEYVSWQYSLRSSDGHIAHHVDNENVAWHAGNWYVNMHSIGLEHEGFAAEGTSWYTEAMYQTSATLVRHLARKYDVPLDRAHIIGHDQVPGIDPAHVQGMHWDPGPYWDWEHYMDLLGAPIRPDRRGRSDVVTVAPGFEGNANPVTGCTGECVTSDTNFVYLRTAPSEDAPLVKDIGLHPDGSPSTTEVWDIGARAAAGHKFLVADRKRGWIGVWYLGDIAWIKRENAAGESVVRPSRGKVVVPAGDEAVPVYGRAYPEEAAYDGTEVPVQPVVPLQYSVEPGQAYVLADRNPSVDYYYAKTFDSSIPDDHTVVAGDDEYYQFWFGHRIAYVRADDVRVKRGVAKLL